jgi:hypothetical protein
MCLVYYVHLVGLKKSDWQLTVFNERTTSCVTGVVTAGYLYCVLHAVPASFCICTSHLLRHNVIRCAQQQQNTNRRDNSRSIAVTSLGSGSCLHHQTLICCCCPQATVIANNLSWFPVVNCKQNKRKGKAILYTVGYARTNIVCSRTSFVVACIEMHVFRRNPFQAHRLE